MDNQHRHITGYRDLSAQEIEAMNMVKAAATDISQLVEAVSAIDGVDQRWVAIARTGLQQAFMALTRAIAKPTSF